MKMGLNTIPDEDIVLFKEMSSSYFSENEKFFFEEMQRRETGEQINTDLLILEDENPYGIAFIRYYGSEYKVCRFFYDKNKDVKRKRLDYCVCLVDILKCNVNMLVEGAPTMTLLEWLRETDYKYVHYDRIEEF